MTPKQPHETSGTPEPPKPGILRRLGNLAFGRNDKGSTQPGNAQEPNVDTPLDLSKMPGATEELRRAYYEREFGAASMNADWYLKPGGLPTADKQHQLTPQDRTDLLHLNRSLITGGDDIDGDFTTAVRSRREDGINNPEPAAGGLPANPFYPPKNTPQ